MFLLYFTTLRVNYLICRRPGALSQSRGAHVKPPCPCLRPYWRRSSRARALLFPARHGCGSLVWHGHACVQRSAVRVLALLIRPRRRRICHPQHQQEEQDDKDDDDDNEHSWRVGHGRTAAHRQGGVKRRAVGGDEGGEAVGPVRRERAVLATRQLAAPLAQHAHLGGYRGRVGRIEIETGLSG